MHRNGRRVYITWMYSRRRYWKSELNQVAGRARRQFKEQSAQNFFEVNRPFGPNPLGHSPEGESVAKARTALNTINSSAKCSGMLPPSAFTNCCRERVCKVSFTPQAHRAAVGVRLEPFLGLGAGGYDAACRPSEKYIPPEHKGV